MGKNYVVIVAAGKGVRMGNKLSKQFIEIHNRPLLYYTLKAFMDCDIIDRIVLVVSKQEMDFCKVEIIDKYNFGDHLILVEGGTERQESVYNGLKAINDCNIVLIHDGARPMVDKRIIEEGIKYAEIYGASACGVRPKDTIKIKDQKGFSSSTLDRDMLIAVQTPQCFKYDIIMECHENFKMQKISVTDDTMIVEKYGYKVFLYEGDYKNIKITTPEDLLIAESLL